MNRSIQCLLWDFGDTLCDERFVWNSGPQWMAAYRTFDDGWARAWTLGEMDTKTFAVELAQRVSLRPDDVVAHMNDRCAEIEYHAFTYAFFRARHLPQAIVTVNPDLFSDVIVPRYRLDEPTDAIVTSWEEKTTDKGRLCEIALARMGLGHDPAAALLIDNRRDCLDAWAARGGSGYHFTTDEAFRSDVAGGIDGLPIARS
ncbi:MAG: HAD family hydrolase [Planctomycetota bacterium]